MSPSCEVCSESTPEFIDNVSHELRTPLSTVSLLAETLAREAEAADVPPKMRDRIGKIEVEMGHLVQMVNELLDLSRIEAGTSLSMAEDVDLGRLAASSAERLRLFAERQGVALHVEVEAELPRVRADEDRIGQVFVNLVHNAVKFSPDGGEVIVRVRHVDDVLAASVEDHGVGIPRAAQARIFERFYKADRSRARPRRRGRRPGPVDRAPHRRAARRPGHAPVRGGARVDVHVHDPARRTGGHRRPRCPPLLADRRLMDRLHVATLNILNLADRWYERLPLLLADFAALQPDLIGMQEVVYVMQQDRVIGAAGDGQYAVVRGWAGRPEYGNSLMSKLPLVPTELDRLDLGIERSIRRARFELADGGSVVFAVTHLHHLPADQAERLQQTIRLLDWLDESRPRPMS